VYAPAEGKPPLCRTVVPQPAAAVCFSCHAHPRSGPAPQWGPDCRPGDIVCAVSVILPPQKVE